MQVQDLYTIGLDVDDKNFHGFIIQASTGEVENFSTESTASALIQRLKKIKTEKENIKICYEATYLGFSLLRELNKSGYACEVIAPSLVPKKKGDKVKTDRLDAEKLARYYMTGNLTVVHVPTLDEEADRGLLRSRKFLSEQLTSLKLHINSATRRLGWSYKSDSKGKTNWTPDYVKWLRAKVKETKLSALKINMQMLLRQYESLLGALEEFTEEIEKLSQKPNYIKSVQALTCYRGIDTLSAMVLLTELGDIKRFKHPCQLTSYAGIDVIESSSGGKERKFHISKDGNKFIRTTVVEACQMADKPIVISKRLKQRRQGVDATYIAIADRCMQRLNKKSRRLLARSKARNKVKVACAREMLCFIWESMRAAALAA